MENSLYITNLQLISSKATEREEENDQFLKFIQQQDDEVLDNLVHKLNENISVAIDCTQCGNCCKSLIINVASEEVKPLADCLGKSEESVKEQFIEESLSGNLFINSIPCHFLEDNKCTIYENRFKECRDFPHLHKPGFRKRLSGTLLHYGNCPIVFNVIESMKVETGFNDHQ